MKQLALASILCAISSCIFSQSIAPIDGDAKWKVAQSLPEAPGQPVGVRSIQSNSIIAYVKPDTKFLSFGEDSNIVTLSVMGNLGYIPTEASADLYPIPPRPELNPGWGPTLEQLADSTDSRSKNADALSLAPLKTPTPTLTQNIGGMNMMPTGMPYAGNPHPGAALANGGINGIANMVGQEPMGK